MSTNSTSSPAGGPSASPTSPGLIPARALFAALLSALTAGAIAALIWLGALAQPQTESFAFSRGTGFADGEALRLRGYLAAAAQDATLSVVIVGHTGQNGDADANLALSEARAEAAGEIAADLGIAADRISLMGVAGGDPLPKQDGQSDRAYQSSLARVDITLQVQR